MAHFQQMSVSGQTEIYLILVTNLEQW